jgi:hypothetical protein
MDRRGMRLALTIRQEVCAMRITRTAFACVTGAILVLSPAYADQHGNSASAPGHAQAAKTVPATAKPTPASSTTTATPPPNPIASKIASKPQLNAKVTSMLPKGMTLQQASLGFKNQGQFIAALHVSQNLGIPFASLKKDMVQKNMSLGQSIQDLKPAAHATDEARKGQAAADHDLDDSKK